MYKAHINGGKIQRCKDHSINTAEYSAANLQSLGLSNVGYLCGIIHDAGKYTDEFNEYLETAANGESVRKGSVIHTFAAVRMMMSEFHTMYNRGEPVDEWSNLTAELVSVAVGSHHGQFDIFDDNSNSGFDHRMKTQPEYDKTAIQNFYNECCKRGQIINLFKESEKEVECFTKGFSELTDDIEETLFFLGCMERLLTSSLMDGDRRDTAEFMLERKDLFKDYTDEENESIWNSAYDHIIKKIDSFPFETELQRARREMSDYCEKFSEQPGGIYRLNLPTGAGKTLSSLRYAIAHAKKYKKKHIIFAVPLLSILDQNAAVIRDAVGNDDVILEHHSNVVIEDNIPEKCLEREILTETWNSPIIITTLVQLLNTMFDGKTSAIRRFHNLVDSVVVIDEVQSVPEKMISMFNMMLNFLGKLCNTTFILCSATQPLLELNSHKLLVDDKEIIPGHKMLRYKEIFRRNRAVYGGNKSVEEVCELTGKYLTDYGSVLVICNTKYEAAEIYEQVRCYSAESYHLSTSMCMAHRKEILKLIAEGLRNNNNVICVSTQLIEAGVDVSFGAVIRLTAGIDNIVQAAGRCNRNGEKEKDSPVSIVNLMGENLSKLKEIKRAQDVTIDLITEYNKNPSGFNNNLLSDEAVDYYYDVLFKKLNNINNYTDYCIDDVVLFDLLACNKKYTPETEKIQDITIRQAFKTAGQKFEVFSSEQTGVIVPYGKGTEVINEILSFGLSNDLIRAKKLIKAAKEYTVNVFNYQIEKLKNLNAIYTDEDHMVMILNPDFYDDDIGIILKERKETEWSTLIL